MKKIALIMGLAGCFSLASADIIRTFDNDLAGEYADLSDYTAFSYGDDGTSTVPATGKFGSGNVFKMDFTLDGRGKNQYPTAGVGFAMPGWTAIDASALPSVKISLRTDIDRIITITLKNSEDADYDAMNSDPGISYDVNQEVTNAGVTVTLLPTKFVFPSWWKDNTTATAWVGGKTPSLMNSKRASVLSSLTAIQIAAKCDSCEKTVGWVEIDSLVLKGVTAEGEDWHDDISIGSGVRSRGIKAQSLRATIDGSVLNLVKSDAGSASLELVRLDGSRVGNWTVSGSKATIALPTSLEKGTYFAVMSSAGKRSSVTVSVVR